MKKNMSKYTILTITLICLFFVFRNNELVKENIILAVNLWLTKVFPSLFPMFIISDILIYCDFPKLLSHLIGKPFQCLFKTSKLSAFVFLTSLLCGTPSNAFLLKELVLKQLISTEDAEKIVAFSFFNNPLFLSTMLTLIFKDFFIVIKLILIHYFSNILIGLFLRNKVTIEMKPKKRNDMSQSIWSYLPKSIEKSMNTLIMILGTITFFLMLKAIFTLPHLPLMINSLFSGSLELTQGLNTLIYGNFSTSLNEILALCYMCFGGLSIHIQVKTILNEADIHYIPFLKGRILHVIIANVILFIINNIH